MAINFLTILTKILNWVDYERIMNVDCQYGFFTKSHCQTFELIEISVRMRRLARFIEVSDLARYTHCGQSGAKLRFGTARKI